MHVIHPSREYNQPLVWNFVVPIEVWPAVQIHQSVSIKESTIFIIYRSRKHFYLQTPTTVCEVALYLGIKYTETSNTTLIQQKWCVPMYTLELL